MGAPPTEGCDAAEAGGAAAEAEGEAEGEAAPAVPAPPSAAPAAPLSGELARPLADYEALTGGSF